MARKYSPDPNKYSADATLLSISGELSEEESNKGSVGMEYIGLTAEEIKKNKEDREDEEDENLGSTFKLRSGNTTTFKQMGSSPLKQDYVGDRYHPKFNPTGTKGKSGTTLSPHAKPKNILPKRPRVKTSKVGTINWRRRQLERFTRLRRASILGTAGAAASLIYDFGKESVRRKKAGLSGFNIKKTPTNRPIKSHAPPKIHYHKPFTFNKPK